MDIFSFENGNSEEDIHIIPDIGIKTEKDLTGDDVGTDAINEEEDIFLLVLKHTTKKLIDDFEDIGFSRAEELERFRAVCFLKVIYLPLKTTRTG
jgi:hypothetical protein